MKAQKIVSQVLIWIPAILLGFSAGMKFTNAPEVVEGLTKAGIVPNFPLPLLAAIEAISAMLFLIPATHRVGFFLVCSYLGGAGVTELASHQPPMAFAFLAMAWIGMFLRDKTFFLGGKNL